MKQVRIYIQLRLINKNIFKKIFLHFFNETHFVTGPFYKGLELRLKVTPL